MVSFIVCIICLYLKNGPICLFLLHASSIYLILFITFFKEKDSTELN